MGIYTAAGQSADDEVLRLTAQLAQVTAERDDLQRRLDDVDRAAGRTMMAGQP